MQEKKKKLSGFRYPVHCCGLIASNNWSYFRYYRSDFGQFSSKRDSIRL